MSAIYGDLQGLCDVQGPLDKILLTGATGFVGSHLLFWRMRAGGRQHLLVRGATPAEARQRLARALDVCAASYSAPFDAARYVGLGELVLGDVTQPWCGLDEAQLDALAAAGITQVWHCAASLEYQERHRETILRTNVEGAQNVLSLAHRIGARHFVHVSTAYTAGALSGTIPEALHGADVSFNNCYEESKHLAERQVHEFCRRTGLAYSILRPTVIVGPSESRRSGGTRFGIYGFVSSLHKSRELLLKAKTPVCLVGDVEAALNFVPIDQVVYDMLWLSKSGLDDGRVYHLTNGGDLNLKQAMTEIDRLLQLNGSVQFVAALEGEPSPLQGVFDRRTKFYGGYYASKKSFARSLPAHRTLTISAFRSYIATFLAELKAGGDNFGLQRHQVKADGGAHLVVYTCGEESAAPILIANAYGLPAPAVGPLALRLARTHRVITWETRWVPALEHPFDAATCDSGQHARDLVSILNHFGIGSCPVIGWSSGVQVALRALVDHPDRLNAGVLMHGTVPIPASMLGLATDFERDLRTLFPRIRGSLRQAQKYCDLVYGGAGDEREGKRVASVLASSDPFLLHMTSLAFRSPERLYRYANMVATLFTEDWLAPRVRQPTLVVCGEQDVIASAEISTRLAADLGAELCRVAEWDHFSQYYEEGVAARIASFVASLPRASARSQDSLHRMPPHLEVTP